MIEWAETLRAQDPLVADMLKTVHPYLEKGMFFEVFHLSICMVATSIQMLPSAMRERVLEEVEANIREMLQFIEEAEKREHAH